jgi:dihydroorotase
LITTNFLLRDVLLSDGSRVDVEVLNHRISRIGSDLRSPLPIIEGAGDLLLPGLVDLHTHLREPGREGAETVLSGSQAAVKGGYTALSAMANTSPVADSAGVVEQVSRLGKEAGLCDVFPIGAVTAGLKGESLAELSAMAQSAAKVRIFSDDGKCVSDPLLMRRALEYVKAFGGVIAQHAQEPALTVDAKVRSLDVWDSKVGPRLPRSRSSPVTY